MNEEKLVEVRELKKYYKLDKHTTVKAVDGISFDILKGEIFGLVGESGSGKSTTGKALMHLFEPTGGSIFFDGLEISDKAIYRKNRSQITREVQMIFQDAASAVNTRMTIGEIIAEPLKIRSRKTGKKELREKAAELMALTGLSSSVMDRYPSEFSGGQLQRACIARALALNPKLIIADEPIASLDVSIQAQIVNLFKKLQEEGRLTCLFIAHDLAMVRYISDRIGVMHRGQLVELAPGKELFSHPVHPYTQSLIEAIPVPDPLAAKRQVHKGYDPEKTEGQPVWREVTPGHFAYTAE